MRRKHNLANKEAILYLGQLHGGQYVKMFIEAANIVLHHYANTVFLIVGQGYMLDSLKKLAVGLDIKEHVIFTGSVDHDEIPNYIAASDICVACFEDNDITVCKSPLKVVEYLASGKPIVASLVGEVRNMVGGAGLLVAPSNYPALAKAITEFLGNKPIKY